MLPRGVQATELRKTEVEAKEPLVIVVHGIGGGNRPDGWSNDVAKRWRVGRLQEVTFRYPGRSDDASISVMDFARKSGDWTLEVQRQIKEAVRANPGRPVVIVSHSWGSVVTKMALCGGSGGGTSKELVANTYQINPIDLGGVKIEEWVTIGSPLGRANNPKIVPSLEQLHVEVPDGCPSPKLVKHWANIYDEADPVSVPSHNLAGAENIPVSGSGHWYNPMSAHTGIWVNDVVKKHMSDLRDRLTPASAKTGRPGGEPKGLLEYRQLYEAYLPVFHSEALYVELRANAADIGKKQGKKQYRCAYGAFSKIPDGPRKGEIYESAHFDRFFTIDELNGLIQPMKDYLKNPPKPKPKAKP
jgi:hypothetical protein